MKLRCELTRSSSLPSHQRGRSADIDTAYPLTAGHEYAVVGMLLWENVLSVLVRDDWGMPCFAPAGLFEFGARDLPDNWRFAVGPGLRAAGRDLWVQPCGAVWGYDELVDLPMHKDGLLERAPDAMAIFERRLTEALTDSV